MFVNYAELLLPSKSSVCIAWSLDSYSQAHKIRLCFFDILLKKKTKTKKMLQNDYMLSTRRALAFHWWILDLHTIGPFFSHVILIIFRSGDFQTVHRYTELRINKRAAKWMTRSSWNPKFEKKDPLANNSFLKRLILFLILKREYCKKKSNKNECFASFLCFF